MRIILTESLVRSWNVRQRINIIVFDGAPQNISGAKKMGANLTPKEGPSALRPFVKHPSPDIEPPGYEVSMAIDYVHGYKLQRNALHDLGKFHWPGVGWIEWEILENLWVKQREHGSLRCANKVGFIFVHF